MLGSATGFVFDLGTISTLGGGSLGANGTTIVLATTFDCALVVGQCAFDPVGTSDPTLAFYTAGGSGGGGGSAGGIALVPEPGSLLLIGGGLAALARLRRRSSGAARLTG